MPSAASPARERSTVIGKAPSVAISVKSGPSSARSARITLSMFETM